MSSAEQEILAAFERISCLSDLIHANQRSQSLFQDNSFFQLAFVKQQRRAALHEVFRGKLLKKIWISNNIRLLKPQLENIETGYLEKDFFLDHTTVSIEEKAISLNRSLVVFNNNDVHLNGNLQNFLALFEQCADTIFLAWDWDNHHWLSLSCPLAAFSDIYCPSHYENLYPLTRFNAATAPAPCGVVQWTSEFFASHVHAIEHAERTNQPLGKHIFYAGFDYRNQAIATLHPHYPDIGFSTHQFHELTPEQKFDEWIRYKLHFIVPVLNDVPIRLFDAWITGGIPLVPESLRFSPVFSDANADDIVFYTAADLIDPVNLIERAIRLFDRGGVAAILRRHAYGLAHHHGDRRIQRMLEAAQALIGFTLAG